MVECTKDKEDMKLKHQMEKLPMININILSKKGRKCTKAYKLLNEIEENTKIAIKVR
jgi:hypothetical protein